jgi:hypothetical protein
MKYAFCEPETVGGAAPWCLRLLTDTGPKYGGGIDTDSLCGRVKAHHGWDVDVPVTQDRLDHPRVTCAQCRSLDRWRPGEAQGVGGGRCAKDGGQQVTRLRDMSDEHGDWIETVPGDQEVTHSPDQEDCWSCAECGKDAKVEAV